MVGSSVFVYHYDKLKVAIPYDSARPDAKSLALFWGALGMESSIPVVPAFLALLVVSPLAVGAVKYYSYVRSTMDLSVKSGGSFLRYINHCLSLLATVLLAIGLMVGIGVADLKGMLYVESGNSFITGLGVLLGVAVVLFGPAFCFQVVHALRTTTADTIVLVRNSVLVGGLSRLTYNIWSFVTHEDLAQLPLDSTWDLFVQIALHLFS